MLVLHAALPQLQVEHYAIPAFPLMAQNYTANYCFLRNTILVCCRIDRNAPETIYQPGSARSRWGTHSTRTYSVELQLDLESTLV